MNIKLYNFSKRKNSTLQPTGGSEVSVVLKSECSIYTPIFMLSSDNVESYNYLSWDNRYYYITDIVKTNINGTWEINCTLDPLATYKSDILNTSAFVLYSTKAYNEMLADNRLSVDPIPSTLAYYTDCFNWTPSGLGGTYILSFITAASSNISYSPIGVVLLDNENVEKICAQLMSDGMISAMTYISQQLGSAKEAIVSCKHTPITSVYSGTDVNIMLGTYATGIVGKSPSSRTIRNSINVTIPRIFSDFRITGEYNRLLMFLPAYGFININATDFTGESTISVKYVLDLYTGELTYIVGGDKGQRVVTSIAADIPLGSNKTDVIGSVTQVGAGAVSAGIGLATGNALATIGGIGAVFNGMKVSMEHNVGVNGSMGGISSIIANVDTNLGKIYLVSINRDTNVDPSTMAEKYGRPLNEVRTLSALSGGYVQTADASVATNAPESIKDEINNYLNGGVYIE